MTINTSDIPQILATYVDTEIAPKTVGLQKLITYGMLGMAQRKTDALVAHYSPILKAAGIMPSDTTIDLELAHDIAKFAMDKTGQVSVMDYIMDSSDVESIYSIAKGYAH